jgi:GxxExxY protein
LKAIASSYIELNFKKPSMTENELAKLVVNLCIKIHKALGPGLLESVYETVLCYELTKAGIEFQRQKKIGVVYEELSMDVGFRADIIVAEKLLVELKSSESVTRVHQKILLTYLRISKIRLGLLINFRVELLKDGINRIVNNL